VGYLENCVRSVLEKNTYPHYELIIVDNSSQETATRQFYNQLISEPRVRILENPSQFNYSAFNNFGARHAQGDLLLFLNNDIEAQQDDWLEELIRWTERTGVGIVGTKLLYPDGSIQHAGIVVGMEGHASHVYQGAGSDTNGPFGHVDWYRNYSAVTGACMLIRKDVFQQIGGFNEKYQLVFNDVEICLRAIRAGYRVVLTPYAGLIHHEGMTRAKFIPKDDILQGYQDVRAVIETGDPYYNPNLSYAYHIPTLKRNHEEEPSERISKIVSFA
jgi:GT2 family glycosyltransferase